jgi:TetR/AcrR family transcriptional repressor of nem operon
MKKQHGTRDIILDAAENMARDRGYSGFSFREIASSVGIKSASVHYHFPTKDELGAAVASRYTDNFMSALGAPDAEDRRPELALKAYIEAFRKAAKVDRKMCLCGIFGSEVGALPAPVAEQTKKFFDENEKWLTALFQQMGKGESEASDVAVGFLAVIEGAVLLSRIYDDPEKFEVIMRSYHSIPVGSTETQGRK